MAPDLTVAYFVSQAFKHVPTLITTTIKVKIIENFQQTNSKIMIHFE